MKKIINTIILIGILTVSGGVSAEAKTVSSFSRPSAICKDGTYSYSKNRRGTCSHHKGVKIWLRQ
jgi:hypothetical protein